MAYETYNITRIVEAPSGTNSLLHIIQQISAELYYTPGIGLIVATFLIFFIPIYYKTGDVLQSYIGASWISTLLALVFYPMQIISGVILITCLFSIPVGLVLLYFRDK